RGEPREKEQPPPPPAAAGPQKPPPPPPADTDSTTPADEAGKTSCRGTPPRSGKIVRRLSCRSTTSPSAPSSASRSNSPRSRTASGIVYGELPPSSRSKNHSRRCASDSGTSPGRDCTS